MRPRVDDAAPRRATAGLGHVLVPMVAARAAAVARLRLLAVEQALFNLLDNAAKYSSPGGRTSIQQGPSRGRTRSRLRCVTRAPAFQPIPWRWTCLFDKFYRVDSGDRRRAGTGLGLAIANKGFIEAQVALMSPANRGETRERRAVHH